MRAPFPSTNPRPGKYAPLGIAVVASIAPPSPPVVDSGLMSKTQDPGRNSSRKAFWSAMGLGDDINGTLPVLWRLLPHHVDGT